MLILVFVLLLVHVAEIWIFSLAYFVLIHLVGAGHILGHDMANFFDYVYFSAVVYSTVGFGDLYPVGAVRFLAGTEALAGFVLLTWSASFVFLEMQRFWKNS